MAHYFLKKAAPVRHSRFPKSLIYFYYQMLQQGICEEIALMLIEGLQHTLSPDALGNKERVRDCLTSEIEKGLLLAGPLQVVPGKTRVAALVGPTGVGKTTTIAKLAALYALGNKNKVALVTVDTYRIAAAEQLRAYARIMGLPFKRVSSPREFSHVFSDFCDRDLILVDTAGRSPRDLSQLEELRNFLKQSFPVEVHLVMSITHKDDTLSATGEQFKVLPVDKIIFTKLDEAHTLGSIVNQLYKMRKPLSYVTTGQKVPEDIEVATREHIIPAVLGERNTYCC
jgi:flagellar biosynthesis protein FlhF